jgi:hypothetical protein
MADYMDEIDVFVTEETKAAEMKAKKRNSSPPSIQTLSKKRVLEIEIINRNKVLHEPIPSSNAGYKLLQKFGFQGSEKTESSDIIMSHIPNNLRGRINTGVGIVVKSKVSETSSCLKAKEAQSKDKSDALLLLERGFRGHQMLINLQKEIASDLKKARKIIYELDIRKDFREHSLWPSNHRESKEEEEEGCDESEVFEAISYLRKVHLYCLYCGFEFDSVEGLLRLCPGKKEDH